MERYIAFDVETPNYCNDCICSIGVTVVEDGKIVLECYDLVDPEARFDAFNVRFHGIGPAQVRGAKNFPTLWQELAPIFDSGILVAHNASFDLGVLKKLFARYGIRREQDDYVCTVRMGRKFLPDAPNHKLDTMCALLNIPLQHHHAASDSHACAEILRWYLGQGFPVGQQVKPYVYTTPPSGERWF